jgi:hypothetical protein
MQERNWQCWHTMTASLMHPLLYPACASYVSIPLQHPEGVFRRYTAWYKIYQKWQLNNLAILWLMTLQDRLVLRITVKSNCNIWKPAFSYMGC